MEEFAGVASRAIDEHLLALSLDLATLGLPGRFESRIAESLPFDVATLELAIERYLDQIDDLGVGVARALAGRELYYWLAAVALGITAGELARRRYCRPPNGSVSTETGGETTSDWFLGLSTKEG